MMSRREARAARLADAKHSREVAAGGRFATAPDQREAAGADAAQGKRRGVVAESATASHRGDVSTFDADGAPPGLAKLRAMPIVREVRPLHPLRVMLESKGVSVRDGAELLGVSERSLCDVLTWRRCFPLAKRAFFARYLRVAERELFP